MSSNKAKKKRPPAASRRKAVEWAEGVFSRLRQVRLMNRLEQKACMAVLLEMYVSWGGKRLKSTDLPPGLNNPDVHEANVAREFCAEIAVLLGVVVPGRSEILRSYPPDASEPAEQPKATETTDRSDSPTFSATV